VGEEVISTLAFYPLASKLSRHTRDTPGAPPAGDTTLHSRVIVEALDVVLELLRRLVIHVNQPAGQQQQGREEGGTGGQWLMLLLWWWWWWWWFCGGMRHGNGSHSTAGTAQLLVCSGSARHSRVAAAGLVTPGRGVSAHGRAVCCYYYCCSCCWWLVAGGGWASKDRGHQGALPAVVLLLVRPGFLASKMLQRCHMITPSLQVAQAARAVAGRRCDTP
jgi:hypothetical protein